MTTRYVDNTLSEATATYDQATRSPTGGSAAGYPDLVSAYTASSNDDVIECRSGSAGTLSTTLTIAKRLTVRPYTGESAWVDAGSFDADKISITISGPGSWELDIKNGTCATATRRVLFAQGANWNFDVEIINCQGQPFRSTGAIGSLTSSKLKITDCWGNISLNNSGSNNVWSGVFTQRYVPTSSTNEGNILISAGTHTLENPVFLGGGSYSSTYGGVHVSGASTNVTINDPLIIAQGIDRTGAIAPIRYGLQTSTSGCVVTVNNGMIQGHILKPEDSVYSVGSGTTLTLNGVLFNGFDDTYSLVQATERAMVASFELFDHNHLYLDASPPWNVSGSISMNHWMQCFKAAKANFSFAPDDTDYILSDPTQLALLEDCEEAGNELIFYNPSSTSFQNTWVFGLQINGASSINNIDVIVSGNSTVFTLVNADTSEQIAQYTNVNNIGNPGYATVNDLYYKFANQSIGGSNFVMTSPYVTQDYGLNAFDDCSARCISDGTYRVTKSGETRLPVELSLMLVSDLDEPRSRIESHFGYTFSGFLHYRTSSLGVAKSDIMERFDYALSGNGNNGITPMDKVNSIPNFDEYELATIKTASYRRGNSTTYSNTPEKNIREYARTWATACYVFGVYPIWDLERVTNIWGTASEQVFSANDIKNMIDELTSCGVSILTVGDAVRRIKAIKAGSQLPAFTRYSR